MPKYCQIPNFDNCQWPTSLPLLATFLKRQESHIMFRQLPKGAMPVPNSDNWRFDAPYIYSVIVSLISCVKDVLEVVPSFDISPFWVPY